MKDLRSIGESGWLARLRTLSPLIGDDAAVLPDGLVAATDLLVEDVHFRLAWSSPADVGWKAAAVNASDLAAMGAEPRHLLVGIGAPPDTPLEVLDGIYEGLVEHGPEIAGGDTVRADRIVIAVTALGHVDGRPMLRSGARPGDMLAVTGRLGAAAAGLDALRSGVAGPSAERHRRPVARVREGVALRRGGAHAAIDLSDGLAVDLRRLCDASGVGARLDIVPIAEGATEQQALGGGEDYELLVAMPEPPPAGVELIRVGNVTAERTITLRGEPLADAGYDHFR